MFDKINDEIVLNNMILLLKRREYFNIKQINNINKEIKPNIIANKNENEQILVFFINFDKVTIKILKSILFINNSDHIIIVHAFLLTPDSKQIVINNKNPIKIEIFSYSEMLYDPIEISPIHKKIALRPKEWKKLPIILSSDIISRYYLFEKGDIISIEENDCLSYRRCV